MQTVNPILYLQRVGTLGVAFSLVQRLSLCSFESVAGAVGLALREVPRSEGWADHDELAELTSLIHGYGGAPFLKKYLEYRRVCELLALNSHTIDGALKRIDHRHAQRRYEQYMAKINLPPCDPPRLKISWRKRQPILSKMEEAVLRILKENGALRGKHVAEVSNARVRLGEVYALLAHAASSGYVGACERAPDASSTHPAIIFHVTECGARALAAYDEYSTMTVVQLFWLSALMVHQPMDEHQAGGILMWATSRANSLRLYSALKGLQRDQLVTDRDPFSITDVGINLYRQWTEALVPSRHT